MNKYELKLRYGALFYKKKRFLLSVLGIVIGVAAFFVMVSIGEGAKKKLLKEFETFSPDTITVVAGKTRIRGGRPIQVETATTLKVADAKALERLFGVLRVAPVYENTAVVEYGSEATTAMVVGSTPAMFEIRRFKLKSGRIFTDYEAWHNAKVAVIGSKVSEELFGSVNPVGLTIRVRKLPFKVIGVMEQMGTDASGRDLDNQVIIPISSATNRVFNVDYISSIFVQTMGEGYLDAVARSIDDVMKKRHVIVGNKERDYSIIKAEEILKYKKRSTMIFSALIVSISVISLLVGSFGVMAVMMLSVKERQREIGIRKAFGATKRAIILQFLEESALITSVGGIMGMALGALVSAVVSAISRYPYVLPVKPALLSAVITLFFGVVSGVYPAKKAADVDPIDTLTRG